MAEIYAEMMVRKKGRCLPKFFTNSIDFMVQWDDSGMMLCLVGLSFNLD